jgi:hypothetical protein
MHSHPHRAHRLLTQEDVIYQSMLMRRSSNKLTGLTLGHEVTQKAPFGFASSSTCYANPWSSAEAKR